MYITSRGIDNALDAFMETNMFCSAPPRFALSLLNQTVLIGDNLSLVCNATGSPQPAIYWFFNGSLLQNETKQELAYVADTIMLSGLYSCTAGNVVLNVSSDEAYINVIECPPGTFYEFGSCIKCQKGTFQYNWNQVQCEKCQKGHMTLTAGSVNSSDCYDIDECIANVTSCEQNCKNTNGSFICSCTWINELSADGQSCSDAKIYEQ
ncbi:unnamed protein product [Mytilus edulis]|uniref:Ig-like domain-containing protein n=1 Tax=Mytilus edulis TaxID=6550 RepID=A0A8S3QZV8_MYTED|nr:unnamed protein product [Mytilus edulis]